MRQGLFQMFFRNKGSVEKIQFFELFKLILNLHLKLLQGNPVLQWYALSLLSNTARPVYLFIFTIKCKVIENVD